ncbi:unnamed protein product [Schistosoma mattheei]|uniref:Reverse transcriptase domain-containing protein n=1 Tax=Schistosoma mattheei TaxID=31246 RepID=A0A183NXR0_9TREM|nr:unnamed protein product [Schistosoma mattheei]
MVIRQIKSGKETGPDGIPGELLEANVAVTAGILRIPFNNIWDEEQVRTDWKEGLLIKIPKKRNLSKCDNYRCITRLSIPGKFFTRVLLNRMKDSVDAQLRDQQAGLRKDRSCTDQIATLQITMEQSIDWNPSLCINLIEYEKTFDRVDRTTLWKLLQHYGVPEKIVNIIRNSYDGLNSKFMRGGQLTDFFELGIQWKVKMQLDDLDFADDLALLSQTQQQMQKKTTGVAAASAAVGLNIHKGKSKILRYSTACTNTITLDGEALEDVKTFTYLGSISDEQGGSDADVKARIGKARAAYLQLKNIWDSKELSTNTKESEKECRSAIPPPPPPPPPPPAPSSLQRNSTMRANYSDPSLKDSGVKPVRRLSTTVSFNYKHNLKSPSIEMLTELTDAFKSLKKCTNIIDAKNVDFSKKLPVHRGRIKSGHEGHSERSKIQSDN